MTYSPALPPWAHQTRAIDLSRDKDYFAFLMEMGTGKTKVVIDEFCRMYEEGLVDTVIVLAPKGVYMNWARGELPTHVPERIKSEMSVGVWQSGGGNSANQDILRRLREPSPGLRVLLMNVEALSTGGKARDYAEQYLLSGWPKTYGALDESTYIKNHTANRTKTVIQLGDSMHYRRIMSGLPVPRGPLDMWSQAEFLKPGLLGASFFGFQARYAVMERKNFGSRRVNVVVGYRNVDELTTRVAPWSFRVTKEECLDLPPKVYTAREVELTDEQVRLYSELRDFSVSILQDGGVISSTSVITQIVKLQQLVCGHVKNVEGVLLPVPTNRIDVLMEVLGETDSKVVIWSRFRHDISAIAERIDQEYGEGTSAQFHGGNSDSRHLEAERFMSDPACRFMVASYAGGHGNTWTVADTVVYYSNDYDLEHRAQSEDRTHRGGQTAERVTYIDLIARGTVDEKIVKALRAKINLAAQITGDNYREWLV